MRYAQCESCYKIYPDEDTLCSHCGKERASFNSPAFSVQVIAGNAPSGKKLTTRMTERHMRHIMNRRASKEES